MSMALSGSNGDTQSNIGSSRSISFGFYDENSAEIHVTNQLKPIEFWISKDQSVAVRPFQLINVVNTSSLNVSSAKYQIINSFLVNGFNLSNGNSSMHIQIKPQNTLSFIALVKFGDNPVFNSNYYDLMSLFCPNDLVSQGNDSFYLMFANMSQLYARNGSYVGLAIAEIDSSNLNCFNKSINTQETISKLIQNATFTQNFWLRIYLSGCYYTNTLTNEWTSYGMEVLPDSNVTHTHCQSSHLTTFAGGFIVLPSAIDFNYVWAHASFLDNPVIYSTVIGLICVYIIMGIWSRYMDSKDKEKQGITVLIADDFNLEEKSLNNYYAYEILIFTGNRLNAGTSSTVSYNHFFLNLIAELITQEQNLVKKLVRKLKKCFSQEFCKNLW